MSQIVLRTIMNYEFQSPHFIANTVRSGWLIHPLSPSSSPMYDLESFSEESYFHKYLSVHWHFFRDKSVAEDEIHIPRNLHTFENFNSPWMKIHETMLKIYRRDNQASPDLQITAWVHFKYIFTLLECFLIILLYSILKLNGNQLNYWNSTAHMLRKYNYLIFSNRNS